MRFSLLFAVSIAILVTACKQTSQHETAEMYEASPLSQTMRTMVSFSKQAKTQIANGEGIDSIPAEIWDMAQATGTRDEHLEADFQTLAKPYLKALRGLERGDSLAHYYKKSIDACKSCHSVYCGGPMSIINQLD